MVLNRKRLPPPKETCKDCKTCLKSCGIYFTTLKEDSKAWCREDRCSVCYKATDAISWKGKVRKEEEADLSSSNEKILEEWLTSEELKWSIFLAEVLLRKGVLRWRGTKFLEIVNTAELIEFERQTLPLEELSTFHFRLEKLIGRTKTI